MLQSPKLIRIDKVNVDQGPRITIRIKLKVEWSATYIYLHNIFFFTKTT